LGRDTTLVGHTVEGRCIMSIPEVPSEAEEHVREKQQAADRAV
jgi:hypothetical protein